MTNTAVYCLLISMDMAGAPPELVVDDADAAVGCGTTVGEVLVVELSVTDELERGSSLPQAANARIARDTRASSPALITVHSLHELSIR